VRAASRRLVAAMRCGYPGFARSGGLGRRVRTAGEGEGSPRVRHRSQTFLLSSDAIGSPSALNGSELLPGRMNRRACCHECCSCFHRSKVGTVFAVLISDLRVRRHIVYVVRQIRPTLT